MASPNPISSPFNVTNVINTVNCISSTCSCWNGRKITRVTSLSLMGLALTCGGIAAFSIYDPLNPITIPAWMLAAVAISVAILTCCGGACLWCRTPSREEEQINVIINDNLSLVNAQHVQITDTLEGMGDTVTQQVKSIADESKKTCTENEALIAKSAGGFEELNNALAKYRTILPQDNNPV